MERLVAIALLAAACSPQPVEEAKVDEPRVVEVAGPRTYQRPDSELLTITSLAVGRTYELFVRLPPGYGDAGNAGKQYPVVYLNDAHGTFQIAAGVTNSPMRHGGFEPLIVVGVSYAEGDIGAASRNRDLTPTPNPKSDAVTGGAREYLTFRPGRSGCFRAMMR